MGGRAIRNDGDQDGQSGACHTCGGRQSTLPHLIEHADDDGCECGKYDVKECHVDVAVHVLPAERREGVEDEDRDAKHKVL